MIVGKWSEGAILFGLPQTLGHDQWDMMSPADYMSWLLVWGAIQVASA